MADRFELESNITDIWSSVDDLSLIIKGIEDHMPKDELITLLKGQQTLLNMKVDVAFETLANCMMEGKF